MNLISNSSLHVTSMVRGHVPIYGQRALPNTRSKRWTRSMAVFSKIDKRPTTKPKSLQPAKKKTLCKLVKSYKVMKALEKRAGLVSQKSLCENARILIKCIASIHFSLPPIAAKKYEELEEFSDIDDIVKALQRIFVDRWSLCENIEEQVTRKIKNIAVLMEMGMKQDDTVDKIARRLEKLCTEIMQVS
jgi:hypothetical protein